MLFTATLAATRRVALSSVTSRPLLTRFISSTPAFDAPAKAPAKTSATKASKAKTTSKVQAKPAAKKEKKKVEKKPKFKREDLKVPRRPNVSAWTLFTQTMFMERPSRPKDISETQTEVKNFAAKWKTMTDEEKKPYQDKANVENEKLTKEYEQWKNSVDPKVLKAINNKRKAAGKPRILGPKSESKMPLTSWIRFLGDFKTQQEPMKYKELLKLAGPAWRDLPADRKKVYEDAYAKDLQVYYKQKAASETS
ncbi:hypothetical protein D9756_007212 [Leucocoprinus leucothites]|uniref:HMG box domain-containing protein n=1 Tax=Leucocoprinus leucothites TaxID=201217 RepID=A0A8H5D5P5_9AGAR|nr:hypothetical protein D9756_007212 [Leucoagaricus leucothites]